jgi:RNA polymerase sigma factor (sigma-70 family)
VRLAQEGRAEALDELLGAISPALRRYLERRVGTRLRRFVSVSDVEQEVLMQALQVLRRLSPDASVDDFRALLFQHARWSVGKAVDRNRQAHGQSSAGDGSVPGPMRSFGTVTRADELSWVRERIEHLPEGQRAVVERRMEGRTFGEIGADLGIGEDAVRKRFLSAALHLRSDRRSG